MAGLEELRKKHPCFGGHKDNMGRIHLPVSPGCNIGCRFCDRVRNDYEDRPGITSRVITPEESIDIIRRALILCPDIKVAGIAGPGDTLASDTALDTFRLIKKEFPGLIRCMSTNGLLLSEKADQVIEVGIDSLTVTVNAVDPEILSHLNKFVVYHGKRYDGVEGCRLLIEKQLEGIRKVCDAGIMVKINTVLVPEVNLDHIEEIAMTVAELGAELYNIIPLIPAAEMKGYRAPTRQEVFAAQLSAGRYIELYTHCSHCRADAAGIPGGKDISAQLYLMKTAVGGTFSHG